MTWIEISERTYLRVRKALADAGQLAVVSTYADTQGVNPLSEGVPTCTGELGVEGGTTPLLRRVDTKPADRWIRKFWIRG
jgi:hypothetical protein